MFGKKEKSENMELDRIKKEAQGGVIGKTLMLDFSIILKVLIGIAIMCLLIYFYKDSGGYVNAKKEYEYVESLKIIKKPKVKSENGGTTLVVDGENVELSYIASVNVSGRVPIAQKNFEHDFTNKLAPVNVVLTWGELARNKNYKLVDWSTTGERSYQYYISGEAMQENSQLKNLVNDNSTQCILIPANKEIKSLLKMINTDDYIRMEGYVVNVDCQKKNGGWFRWRSGYDSSGFAKGKSKILLVNKIVWLKANGS